MCHRSRRAESAKTQVKTSGSASIVKLHQPRTREASPLPPEQPADETTSRSLPARPKNSFTRSTRFSNSTASRPDFRSSREVKRKLTSRDEVVSYLTKHLNDEDTQRLRRSELVLKKFGLLPRDFNLETFLVALLTRRSRRLLRPQDQNREPARLGADGRAGARHGPRTHPRPAGPGRRPAEVDEEGRQRSRAKSRKIPRPPTSKTTRSTTRARRSSKARRRP